MAALPFRIYNASDCASIEKALGEALGPWKNQWFPNRSYRLEFRNVTGKADALAAGIRSALDQTGESVVTGSSHVLGLATQCEIAADTILGLPSGEHDTGRGLSGTSVHDQLLKRQLVAECLSDAATRLVPEDVEGHESFSQQQVTMPSVETRLVRGSGAGVLNIVFDEFDLELLLTPHALARHVAPIQIRKIGGLALFLPTIADQKVELRAELGTTVLTIGELDRLDVGDVVRLDQSIDNSPRLHTGDGTVVVSGRLGSQNKHKALQLY